MPWLEHAAARRIRTRRCAGPRRRASGRWCEVRPAPRRLRAGVRLPRPHDPDRGPAGDPGLRPGPLGVDSSATREALVAQARGAARRAPRARISRVLRPPRARGAGAGRDAQRAWRRRASDHLTKLMAAHDLVHRRQIERVLCAAEARREQVSLMFELHRSTRTAGAARAGTLTLPHGQVQTPAFMPVGTHGVVRGLSATDVRRTGAQIILGNTYHLHLRPGEAVVRAMGGLHRFTTWDRPMLTDSGGFQVFSLEGLRRIAEDGVTSRATWTAPPARSRPSAPWRSSAISAPTSPWRSTTWCRARRRTISRARAWSGRCAGWSAAARGTRSWTADGRAPQTLWPIVQGGTHDDLRLRSLEGTLERGPWTGDRDRRALGRRAEAGDAPGARAARARSARARSPVILWVSDFRPTCSRESRAASTCSTASPPRGTAGTAPRGCRPAGSTSAAPRSRDRPSRSIRSATARPAPPIPRGYLRHLFVVEDILGLRLVSIHNVRFLVRLGEQARARILDGTFDAWSRDWLSGTLSSPSERGMHERRLLIEVLHAAGTDRLRLRTHGPRAPDGGDRAGVLLPHPPAVRARRGRSTRRCSPTSRRATRS